MKIRSYLLSTIALLVCAMSLSFSAHASDSGPSSDKSIYSTVEYQEKTIATATPADAFHYHPALDDVSSQPAVVSLHKHIHHLSTSESSCALPSVRQSIDSYAVFWLKRPELSVVVLARLAKPPARYATPFNVSKLTGPQYQRQRNNDVALS